MVITITEKLYWNTDPIGLAPKMKWMSYRLLFPMMEVRLVPPLLLQTQFQIRRLRPPNTLVGTMKERSFTVKKFMPCNTNRPRTWHPSRVLSCPMSCKKRHGIRPNASRNGINRGKSCWSNGRRMRITTIIMATIRARWLKKRRRRLNYGAAVTWTLSRICYSIWHRSAWNCNPSYGQPYTRWN